MDWLEIVKLALPAAICAFALGLRTAITFLLVMAAVTVFGVGLWGEVSSGLGLASALAKVAKQGPAVFSQMVGAGGAGIVIGWWLRTWVAMVRSSRMTRGTQSPI